MNHGKPYDLPTTELVKKLAKAFADYYVEKIAQHGSPNAVRKRGEGYLEFMEHLGRFNSEPRTTEQRTQCLIWWEEARVQAIEDLYKRAAKFAEIARLKAAMDLAKQGEKPVMPPLTARERMIKEGNGYQDPVARTAYGGYGGFGNQFDFGQGQIEANSGQFGKLSRLSRDPSCPDGKCEFIQQQKSFVCPEGKCPMAGLYVDPSSKCPPRRKTPLRQYASPAECPDGNCQVRPVCPKTFPL